MCYIFYVLALGTGLVFPILIATESIGVPFGAFYDLVSFIIVVLASFFLVATASGSLSFYKDDNYLKMWGDLGLKMGYIGTVIGFILIFANMGTDAPTFQLGKSLAIASLTLLYGLIFKYMVIAPWLGCRKK